MTHRYFLYGAMCDPTLFEIVTGNPLAGETAALDDMSVAFADDDLPVLVPDAGARAEGLLVDVDGAAKMRLDFHAMGRDVGMRTVETASGPVEALTHVARDGATTTSNFTLADWQQTHGMFARLVAEELMRLADTHSQADAARALPQIRMRAASKARAMANPTPCTLAPRKDGDAVVSQDIRQPYTDYFAVREDHLSYPLFDGGMSETVKRASFLGGDAVTVLPYDPTTGNVLLVRQFRHGPFSRGDTNPWTLEPAAGRIDPGEEPEETARRELLEETGVAAGALHFVGRYYPSPGAYSEYLYSYVAITDLGGRDGGVGGLADEAEDIMAHVLTLDDAMAMIRTGEVNTGPLILSLGWLAMNRDRLG